jgi:uncharacterized protein YndB with AHSA1/START domain
MDDIVAVEAKDAYKTRIRLARQSGILDGPTTGAVEFVALQYGRKREGLAVGVSPDDALEHASFYEAYVGLDQTGSRCSPRFVQACMEERKEFHPLPQRKSDGAHGRVPHRDSRRIQPEREGAIEMLRMDKNVVINRPVEEVFAFVSPGENWSQWATELVETRKTSEGPMGVGTTYVHVAQMLGRRIENDYEVTEYEPNRKVSMKATSGSIPADVAMAFQPVDGGTRVGLSVEAEVGGFFKLAEPLVARMMSRQQDANFANLKDLLEAGALDSA